MFGWELPPYNSGGLGTACLGLTEGLAPLGIKVDFVIPKIFGDLPFSHMNVLSAADFSTLDEIERLLGIDRVTQQHIGLTLGYGNKIQDIIVNKKKREQLNLGAGSVAVPADKQAEWYAYQAAAIASSRHFDIVHCHDWFTYYCGIAAKQAAEARGEHVPFIAHIHATEVDRCGGNPKNADQKIFEIEKKGLNAADRVVAVSAYTKRMVHKHYGVPLNKISVVHNGIRTVEPKKFDFHKLKSKYKLVLSMGRLTIMKGPDYFIQLAKAVTDVDPNVKFLLVGSGDMEHRCKELAAKAGLTGKILFGSFMRGSDVDRAYQMADLFVMPSVSEPFGLVALEALQNGTPALVSKTSGVSEVSNNLIKADFWDIEDMRDKVLEVLHNPDYARALVRGGQEDLKHLTWHDSARKLHTVYRDMIKSVAATPAHA